MGTTESDPHSIMCYQIPGEITKDGKPILGGTTSTPRTSRSPASIYPKQISRAACPAVKGHAWPTRRVAHQNGWTLRKIPRGTRLDDGEARARIAPGSRQAFLQSSEVQRRGGLRGDTFRRRRQDAARRRRISCSTST